MTQFAIPLVTGQAAWQPAELAGRLRLPQAGRTDRGLTVMAVAGVTALSALGWVLSYTALRQLALAGGMAQWAATLWPLCVDMFVFVATLAAVADRRHRRPTTYAWTLAVLYSTVAGNVAAAGPTHMAQAVHAMPAVTIVLAWHLLSIASRATVQPNRPQPCRLVTTPDDSSGLSGNDSRGGQLWKRWQGALRSWRPAVRDQREMRWPRD